MSDPIVKVKEENAETILNDGICEPSLVYSPYFSSSEKNHINKNDSRFENLTENYLKINQDSDSLTNLTFANTLLNHSNYQCESIPNYSRFDNTISLHTKNLKNKSYTRKNIKKDNSPSKKAASPRKKIDRFDGIPEEEVAKKLLPDHLAPNLDILIIGINPGLFAAHKGHHYAGPGNHFWKCLFLSSLTPEQFNAYDDFKMLEYGIGFTNIVSRTTRGSADLSRKEISEGGEILLSKLKYYQPKIAVFNGKGIYEIFSKKKNFFFGKQPENIEGTHTKIWVMPSSSARCSQLPRAIDKVPFYVALKKLRDHLKGLLPELKEEEVVFADLKLTNHLRKEKVKQEI